MDSKVMKLFISSLALVAISLLLFTGSLSGDSTVLGPPGSPVAKEIVVPDTIEPGQLVILHVPNLTLERAKRSQTTFFPRKEVVFVPAITWDGELVLFFSAALDGKYLVGVYPPTDGKVPTVEKWEAIVTVGSGPDPDPDPDPEPEPVIQDVWAIIVEDSLVRTPELQASEEAIEQYCRTKQNSRWKLLDFQSTDEFGKPPKGFANYIKTAKAAGTTNILFIVSKKDGELLWIGETPVPKEKALALIKKYGGE